MAMTINVGEVGVNKGTNINDVVVPEHMRRRVPFGLNWVDALFGGQGVVPSMTILFTGTPGAGKTTLCLQLADAIHRQKGAMALFNSKEESLYQVKMTSERLGLKNGFICGEDELVDAKLVPEKSKKHWTGHSSILDHARHLIDNNPGKDLFLLLDSLQTFNDGMYGPGGIIQKTQLRVIEQLTSFAKTGYNGVHPIIVIVGHVTKSGQFAGPNSVKHAVDAHAHLFIDEVKNSEFWGERIAEVQKNRFGCNAMKVVLGMERTGLYKKAEFKYEFEA